MSAKKYISPFSWKPEQTVEDYHSGKHDNMYASNNWDWFKKVKNPEDWEPCPVCGLRPKVWEFDNGRFTMCACMDAEDPHNMYRHFSIRAESVMSVVHRSPTGTSAAEYDVDGLRKNWNEWAKTGKILFDGDKEYSENHRW